MSSPLTLKSAGFEVEPDLVVGLATLMLVVVTAFLAWATFRLSAHTRELARFTKDLSNHARTQSDLLRQADARAEAELAARRRTQVIPIASQRIMSPPGGAGARSSNLGQVVMLINAGTGLARDIVITSPSFDAGRAIQLPALLPGHQIAFPIYPSEGEDPPYVVRVRWRNENGADEESEPFQLPVLTTDFR